MLVSTLVSTSRIHFEYYYIMFAYLQRRIATFAKGQNDEIGNQKDHHELLHKLCSRIEESVEFFVEGRGQKSCRRKTTSREGRREGNSLRLEEVFDEQVSEDENGGRENGLGEGCRGDALNETVPIVGSSSTSASHRFG